VSVFHSASNPNLTPSLATHLSNYIFDGARADLTKSLSANPLFQVTHSFALGSQTLPSSYNFGAIFANQKVSALKSSYVAPISNLSVKIFLQGGVDHDGNVNARLNQGWTPSNITKVQAQVRTSPTQLFSRRVLMWPPLHVSFRHKQAKTWCS
jgi:mitochondrial import receptor subunit TOM40